MTGAERITAPSSEAILFIICTTCTEKGTLRSLLIERTEEMLLNGWIYLISLLLKNSHPTVVWTSKQIRIWFSPWMNVKRHNQCVNVCFTLMFSPSFPCVSLLLIFNRHNGMPLSMMLSTEGGVRDISAFIPLCIARGIAFTKCKGTHLLILHEQK